MDNGSASAGSLHLTDNSFRTGSATLSSIREGTASATNSVSGLSPPPVPWSEPPVPSPRPHPHLGNTQSVVSLPSPNHPVRFNTDHSSGSPSDTPSISSSLPIAQLPISSSLSPSSSPSTGTSSSSSGLDSVTVSSSASSSVSASAADTENERAASAAERDVAVEERPVEVAEVPQSITHTPTRSLSNVGSPPYSAFQSASDTPFLSPCTPALSTPFLTPRSNSISASALDTLYDDPAPPRTSSAALLANSSKDSTFSPPRNLFAQQQAQYAFFSKLTGSAAPYESPGPSFPRHAASPSPGRATPGFHMGARIASPASSAGRPKNCDVFISLYGKSASLHRFGKWMRAELELQGVACFSADRSLYSDTRSHDIARRIMNSATFGVVIISRDVFRNPWTMEELQVFLERKNLIPVFFDIAPSDCLVSDIVDRQGRIWGRHGGELWNLYGGDELVWRAVVDALLRVEDWRLEAYDGNWRGCIQRAVGLLGSRLGRRSVAERERIRMDRIEDIKDEFPFDRNAVFAGRAEEIKAIEELLFVINRDGGDETGTVTPVGEESCKEGQARISVDSDLGSSKGKEADVASGRIQQPPNSEIESPRNSLSRTRERYREVHRGRQLHRDRTVQRKRASHSARDYSVDPSSPNIEGCVCISGQSGIGKTELAVEYAYRNAHKYKLILWVSAENRYIRQNYLELSNYLGVDVGGLETHTVQQAANERGRVRTFDELETEAYQRIRRELSRDVPYLLIVDNLESERDWWDGKEISDLLPTVGGMSHVIITTCLSRVLQLEMMELSLLSGPEALELMRGKRNFSSLEHEYLKDIDDKLARLTLGLAIVGRLLSDFPLLPSEILDAMKKVDAIVDVRNREDEVLRNNPWLFRLLNVCFSLLENAEGPTKLAARMAWVGGWFAPAPVPFSLLALSAAKYREQSKRKSLNTSWRGFLWCCVGTYSRKTEGEAGYLLVRYGIARRSTREGCLCFHEIVQVFARRRGGIPAATAAVQGVRKVGLQTDLNLNHYWAASFLVLPFGNDTPMVELRVPELLSFCNKIVMPLALCSFSAFTRCQAAIELLHLCYNMLEDVDKTFVSQIQDWWDKSYCLSKTAGRGQVDEYVWQDLTLLKALLLESRAKLLARGGVFEAAEEICRTCISIRTVMLGPHHPQTISAQESLTKLVRARHNAYRSPSRSPSFPRS